MSEDYNENLNTENADAAKRAEKIRAIREALHASSEETAAAEENITSAETVASAGDEPTWDEIAPAVEEYLAAKKTPEVDGKTAEESFAEKFNRVKAKKAANANATSKETESPEIPEIKAENADADCPETPSVESEKLTAEEKAPAKKKKKKKKKKPLKRRIRELFPEKGDKPLEIVRKFVFLGAVGTVIVCGYMVGDYYIDLFRSRMEYQEIADNYSTYPPIYTTQPEEQKDEGKYYDLLPGAKMLLDINDDVVGYLTIPTVDGEPIVSLPVVQADDNKKYLKLNFKGEEARAGSLFMDRRNFFDYVIDHHLAHENSDNIVIHGHNMADESMFGTFKYYQRNPDYYAQHPIVQLNSNYDTYTYKIFAFFLIDAEDDTDTSFECWDYIDFEDEKEFYEFVNEAKKRTIRTNDIDVKYGDELLTLSTCNTLLDDERGRLILMARKVRDGEDPYEGTQNSEANPNVKWPNFFYESSNYSQTRDGRYDPNAPFTPYGPADEKEKETEPETTESANTEE
ncbi:MAG: sortase [Ruminococcus sp.]|nr:sortase [Ruminococcus sp.]